ncbi:MAG: hypothetical protein ACREFI_12330, partial [Stellaceae bacterium]
PQGRVDTETPLAALGKTWRIAEKGLNVKKYPMCYGVHRALDGMLDLVREHKLTAAAVKEIAVTTGKTQATMLRNHRPQTGLEAKFSMEFAMASALTAGRAGLSELTDGFVKRPDVQSAMGKVSIATTDTVAADDPIFAAFDKIDVTLADGKRLASPELRYARGHWALPLRSEELWEKFRDCAGTTLQENGARALFDGLQSLERQGNLRELGASHA